MLQSHSAVLVVVDAQVKLLPFIHGAEETVGQICRLIRGFRIAGAPILVTEQYRKGLGETDPRIQEAIEEKDPMTSQPHHFEPIEKMCFSCVKDDAFLKALEASGRRQVVLCGIESHVCIHQTALDLLGRGYQVEVAADAVSSRAARNRDIALQRLASEGLKLTTVEMAVFEMLEVCGTEAFRAWVKVIR
jgi:nicotinamidase-related amidase